jgi:SAM-dependent methyltransferase
MKAETIAALFRASTALYDAHADAFIRTRKDAWPGWSRVLDEVPTGGPRSVLDAGCGNARFAAFLARARPDARLDYTGLDASPRMLEAARETLDALGPRALAERGELRRAELGREVLGLGRTFSLVVAIGVLHHVPSFELRARVVAELAELTARPGVLALSLWQFGGRPRFERRAIDWREHNATAAEPIDLADL